MQILIEVPSLPHVADTCGNNAAIQCTCGRAFVFSSQNHYYQGATCPHCSSLTAYPNRSVLEKGKALSGPESLLFSLTGQDPNTISAKEAVALSKSFREAA